MPENFELLEIGQIQIMHDQTHERQSEADNCDTLRQQHDSLAAELVKRGLPHDTEMVCPESELAQAAPNYRHGFTDDICNHCAFGQLYPFCNLYKADYTSGYVCDSFRYYEIMELEPPHGFLMANGKQTACADIKELDTEKHYIIVSGGEAFGVAEFEQQPVSLKTKEFELDKWLEQHRITARERRQWWPQNETFFVYRLKSWHPYENGIKLYENGKVIDEPRLTAEQWKIISTAKQLPKQIIVQDDFLELTKDYRVLCGDKGFYNREAKAVFDATFDRPINHTSSPSDDETIPLYSLALVRNPRMRVSKKNSTAEGGTRAEKQEGEDMPYEIVERDDEYCVIKTDDGEVAGCHETEAEAEAQLAALRINVEAEEGESAAHTNKPKKRKPHKKEMFGTEQSIDGRLSFIRGQFDERFSTENNYVWVNDIFESFLVAEDDGRLFRIGYMDINDEIIFAPREQWVEVERGYRPKGFKVLATGLKRKPHKKEIEAEVSGPGFLERLKLAAKSIIDLVTLAEAKETEVKLFVNNVGIGQKLVNGELWHFTYSTNAFEDREGEIFSTKSLQQYVAAAKEKEDRGYFNLWHLPGTDFAQKEWQEVIGRFLVEAGPYLDNERGRAAKEFFKQYGAGHPELAPEGWGCSPEFRYLPEERATGIYENIWITRTSTLPKMAAANIWTETRQLARKDMSYSDEQIKTAIEVFKDEDFVKSLFAEGETKTAELEEANVAHKENDASATPEPQEIQLNMEDLAAEVGKQFQADLTPIADALVIMASDMKEMKDRLEQLEETKKVKDKTETPRFIFNLQRASEDESTVVTDDDGLKNQKPAETQTKGSDPWAQTFNK